MLFIKKWPVSAVLVCIATINVAYAKEPSNHWILKGDAPANYNWGVEPKETHDGSRIAYLKFESKKVSPPGDEPGFGTLMQAFSAAHYRGKRMKWSGFMKTKDVSVHSALWMRTDAMNGKVLGFDNMSKRPITGTKDWNTYAVVLDIPENAEQIALGLMLSGQGQVWVSGLRFEEVDKSVPVTAEFSAETLADQPFDLDFAGTAETK